MIVGLLKAGGDVFEREAILDYVMRGLDVERLLDFGVGSDEEMEEDEGWDEGIDDNVFGRRLGQGS